MFNKDVFYNKTKLFFEAGTLRELITTDKYSLCNLSNSMYVLIYGVSDEYGVGGIFIEPDQAKNIVNNTNYFMNLMIFYKENNALNDRHIFLNQETFANAVKLKNETDIKGPTKYVDLQFENELLENQKSR